MATFMFAEISECQSHCMFQDGCQSINYQKSGENICELNNITTEDVRYEVNLTERKGWTYMTTDHKYTQVSISLNMVAIPCINHCIQFPVLIFN